MRVAVVISPWGSAAESGAWSDAAAWLGASLARLGFRIVMVDGAHDVPSQLEQALTSVGPDDSMLLLVSGRLARRGVLRLADGGWLPLRVLGEKLAAYPTGDFSILAELVHEDDPEDALVGADHVASAVSALGARERGYGTIVAVRPVTSQPAGIPFTRLFLDTAAAAPAGEALLSLLYERVRGMPESLAAAQSFTLVRGRNELELAQPAAPPLDLDAQLEAATKAGDPRQAVQVRRERLAKLESPRAKVKELVAIAKTLQQELSDLDGAIAALEEARSIEPRRTSVLQALARGYEIAGRWASAIEVVGALADATPMPTDRAALRYQQARMTLDHLGDEDRGLAWLEQALEDDPAHAEARATLSRLRASIVPPDVAIDIDVEHLQAVSVVAPLPTEDGDELDPAFHIRAFMRYRREGPPDAAFLHALALEELGASYPDLQTFIDQNRSVAPLRARGTLDDTAWEALRPYGMDEILTALFGAVSRAACRSRVEQLAARGRLVALDPGARLDEASTASVVRTFQWAARVLGVPTPDLYMVPEVPGEIAAVRAPDPTTAVGPSIVSGRSAKDLAFLAGRHLTYYRSEHQVLVTFPTKEELTRLLLSAVQVTKPDVEPAGEGGRAIQALAARIDALLTDDERARLRSAVFELEVRGGKFSVSAWTRNVELMAARAGLFLCGDLQTASAIVSTETRTIAALPLEAKRRDLVAFCVSPEHRALRERYGGSRESIRPPAPPAAANG